MIIIIIISLLTFLSITEPVKSFDKTAGVVIHNGTEKERTPLLSFFPDLTPVFILV